MIPATEANGRHQGHDLVIYRDLSERDGSIARSLGGSLGGRSIHVLSTRPRHDMEFFRALTRDGGKRKRAVVEVNDVRPILEGGSDQAERLWKLWPDAGEEGWRQVVVGDFHHMTYGNIETSLTLESRFAETGHWVCCYRAEGFWSLAPDQLLRIFGMHQQAMVNDRSIAIAH